MVGSADLLVVVELDDHTLHEAGSVALDEVVEVFLAEEEVVELDEVHGAHVPLLDALLELLALALLLLVEVLTAGTLV